MTRNRTFMFRQTRYHGRPLYRQYVQSVREPFTQPLVNYAMAVHGSGTLSQEESDLLNGSGWVDYRSVTDGGLGSLLDIIFTEFMRTNRDCLIIMDDDAMFEMPHFAMHLINQILDKEPECGAFGPLSDFYLHWKYDDKENYEIMDLQGQPLKLVVGNIDRCPWAPYGAQVYTRAFLEQCRWHDILSNVFYWIDYPIFMEAHRLGFKPLEVSIPGYSHKGGGGTITRDTSKSALGFTAVSDAEASLNKDFEYLKGFFKGTDPRYLKDASTIHRNRLRKIKRSANE
jgi:hypothetical protein